MSTSDQLSKGTLGTFAGVFTPSILTILGLILFLRLGFVVGNAGLRTTLIIMAVATALSLLTSMSLAAIATNMEVGAGGDYFLISRTLGVEFGGSIGIVLFLAQSVSIAFYAIGFGEALAAMLGLEAAFAAQGIAAVVTVLLFGLAWLGADIASRFQSVIMVVLILALISFFIGAFGAFDPTTLSQGWSSPTNGLGFWVLFAIFFPAVTGFTQGVSMSGDLRDPGTSLPKGTFAAVGVSTVVYVVVAIFLAGSLGLGVLATNTSSMQEVSAVAFLIDVGVLAATMSSAMASFLGAPRILQSLASDRVFPILQPFAKGDGPTSNPRRGVLASLVIALITISLGNLNVIAPVVSMFFLISYGLLNYATYFEAAAASPSFRPRFRFFDRRASLAGGVLALVAMVMINPFAAVGAVGILYAVRRYLSSHTGLDRWVDASDSHHFARARESIHRLSRSNSVGSGRSWRPQVLAFSANPDRRLRLMQCANWLEGSSGLSTVVEVVQGAGAAKRLECDAVEQAMIREARSLDTDVQCLAVLAPNALEAVSIIAQSYGVGLLRANTVMFGLPEVRSAAFSAMTTEMRRLGMQVVAVSTDAERWERLGAMPEADRRIDVLWSDDDAGHLALLLAYLFTRTKAWGKAPLRVVVITEDETAMDIARIEVEDFLDAVRISADVVAVIGEGADAAVAATHDAGVAFLPVKLRSESMTDLWGDDVLTWTDRLPLTVTVASGSPIDLAAGPKSEVADQIAAVEDRRDQLNSRLRQLNKRRDTLVAAVHTKSATPEERRTYDADLGELRKRILKAEVALEDAERELAQIIGDTPKRH